MAKSEAQPAPEPAIQLSAQEACERLGAKHKAVEALAAFYAEEVAQGRHNDTEAAFAGRFAAFMARVAG